MTVSIIIPFRNKTSLVEKCIESVKKQNYRNIEIIAVSDKDKVLIRGIRSLVNPKCKLVGEKRNIAAKKAKGDILFFLDSDCLVRKDTIKNLVKLFEKTNADAISGKPIVPKNVNLISFVTGLEYEYRFNQIGEDFVDIAATTCLGVKKIAFLAVKGFKGYGGKEAVGEDWDFSARLIENGFKIFHTNRVMVYHCHSDRLLHYLKRQYQHVKYRPTHFKRFGKSSDKYLSWKEIISSSLFLSIPTTIRIYEKIKDKRIFLLPFISILRSIVWFIGGVAGFLFG